MRARVVPAALELIDGDSLDAVADVSRQARRWRRPAPAALLLIEVDGLPEQVGGGSRRASSRRAATPARPRCCARATRPSAQELWRVRRELSPSLKTIAPLKFNHDVVVPKARDPGAVRAGRATCRRGSGLRIPCFGHVGDGNIHVNIMVTPDDADEIARAHEAERRAVRGRRRARGIDQRRARHRLREGAVPRPRADAGDDRADASGSRPRSIRTAS